MNYELAKELKEKGWPQHFSKDVICGVCGGSRSCDRCVNYIYTPTLFELIEACGDQFGQLKRLRGELEGQWEAQRVSSKGDYLSDANLNVLPSKDHLSFHYGMTPEEAMATLWLVLNPK